MADGIARSRRGRGPRAFACRSRSALERRAARGCRWRIAGDPRPSLRRVRRGVAQRLPDQVAAASGSAEAADHRRQRRQDRAIGWLHLRVRVLPGILTRVGSRPRSIPSRGTPGASRASLAFSPQGTGRHYPRRVGTEKVWLSEAEIVEAYRARFTGLADRLDQADKIETDLLKRLSPEQRSSWSSRSSPTCRDCSRSITNPRGHERAAHPAGSGSATRQGWWRG